MNSILNTLGWDIDLPKSWKSNRLKWISKIENSGIWGEEFQFKESISISIPTTAQLTADGKWLQNQMQDRHITKDEWEKYKCITGDIVVVKSSGSSSNIITGKCGYIDKDESENFSFSNFLLRVRPQKIANKFLYYFLCSNLTKQRIEKMVAATTYPNLKVEEYKNAIIFLPEKDEQNLIISHLDKKTKFIDELLFKKEKKIKRLKEYKVALINEAVTKGINPNAKMKNSQIKEIGNIPSHWQSIRLKLMGNFSNGLSKDSDYFGKGYPFITYGDVYNNTSLPTEAGGEVTSNDNDRFKCSIKRGDIFFTRTSESTDDIGIASTCLKDYPDATFSGFVIRFRPSDKRLLPEYSKYFFQNHYKKTFIESRMNIVTRSSLSQMVLGDIVVLFPNTLEEQKEIANYLDAKTNVIDLVISKESKQIKLLKKYKESLISEIISGKTRVIT